MPIFTKRAMSILLFAVLFAARIPVEAQTASGVTLSVENVNVRLHEPVTTVVTVNNLSDGPISVDLGDDKIGNVSVRVLSPDGRQEQHRIPPHEGAARFGKVTIEAGKKYSQTLVLNMWVDFSRVGTYRVAVSILSPARSSDGNSADLGPAWALINVERRDEQELMNLCTRLVDSLSNATSFNDAWFDATVLRYVDDPVAIPFLSQAAQVTTYPVQSVLIKGLESIGTDDSARSLLDLMKANPSFVAEGRVSLSHMAPRISDPDLRKRMDNYIEETH